MLVDSLAYAARVAGLGSIIVILFAHPSSPLAGCHPLALMIGPCAMLIFSSPIGAYMDDTRILSDATLALSLGGLILMMAITDTEHPPAPVTLIGVVLQPRYQTKVSIIIGAVIILAIIRWMQRRYIKD